MQSRRIQLEDGRYLIFYTFEEQASDASAMREGRAEATARAEAEEPVAPQPVAEEERRV